VRKEYSLFLTAADQYLVPWSASRELRRTPETKLQQSKGINDKDPDSFSRCWAEPAASVEFA